VDPCKGIEGMTLFRRRACYSLNMIFLSIRAAVRMAVCVEPSAFPNNLDTAEEVRYRRYDVPSDAVRCTPNVNPLRVISGRPYA
jgi:hypothetical protein